jgi:hypothetical protein
MNKPIRTRKNRERRKWMTIRKTRTQEEQLIVSHV